jgi:hypothetical protein
MTSVTNINEVLNGHVSLDLACIGRLYLNAYVLNLQVAGQIGTFLTAQLAQPAPRTMPQWRGAPNQSHALIKRFLPNNC